MTDDAAGVERPVQVIGYAFAPVPEALLYDQRVSGNAVRVWAVLLRHGDAPENCYPSQERLGTLLGKDERTVRRLLGELEETGWIERYARFNDRGRTSDGYRVLADRSVQDTRTETPTTGRRICPAPPADASLREREPLEREGSLRSRGTDVAVRQPSFEDFWQAYPRKTNKGGARKAWAKAITKISPAELVDAARRYAADPNQPADKTKVPHASTWLNNDRWEDDPLPSAEGGRPKSRMERTLANLAPFFEEEQPHEQPRDGNGIGAPGRGLPTRGGA